MACYHPLKGYRSKYRNPSGKRSIVFNSSEGFADQPVELPCGQCIGCRLERSRQWAIRCIHEASLYENNSFITLTYSDTNLPKHNSLNLSHFQNFMKRLRFHFSKQAIRFFHCGEYGENFGRPHYHACLFNLDFSDKTHWKTVNGEKYYVSPTLEKLWGLGHTMTGDVTFESAAYVARYITKKVTGALAENHYQVVDPATGEIADRKKEYVTMSRRPGIGKAWFDKFKQDVFPWDFVIVRGKKMKPPKFYNGQLEIAYPTEYLKLKAIRKAAAADHAADQTWERLAVREEIHYERFSKLKRGYENDY